MLDSAALIRSLTVVGCVWLGLVARAADPPTGATRPNILWITCEDMSPDLGCYGDAYARSPTIDRLAAEGQRFTRVFTHAGVCAPSRSGIITGMYPSTLGTQHMRSRGLPPSEVRCFPEYLREAGYFCTNNNKTDYNFDVPAAAWDENGKQAHWRHRRPGQPFFAVFNLTVTHESQIRVNEAAYQRNTARLQPADRHDPAGATLPPYYPDTPVVRRDWARYHDNITAMDLQVADRLAELAADGLAEETIVFFFSDHGRGLTRAKRWLYDSGLHVPLVVRWPGQLAAGSVNNRLVAFVDLAPTVLRLAGVSVPSHMQGQPFLGGNLPEPRQYVFGARDRMDERYDLIRYVRDARYKYIRNYEPWKPYAQHIAYAEQMPTLREMRRLHAAGELRGAAALFFRPEKPREELYDTEADPHEVVDLATRPEHEATLRRLRAAHGKWSRETHDLGLVPEPILYATVEQARALPAGSPQRDAWRSEWAHEGGLLARLQALQEGANIAPAAAAERYWALAAQAAQGSTTAAIEAARPLLRDPESLLRVQAAGVLAARGEAELALPALIEGLADPNPCIRLMAAQGLDALGPAARPAESALRKVLKDQESFDYVLRVAEHALAAIPTSP